MTKRESEQSRIVLMSVWVKNHTQKWRLGLEAAFILLAVLVGLSIAQADFSSAVPIILAMVGYVLTRFCLKQPFYKAFTLYVMLAAFNYYYFYCSALTGRNPTDVGSMGIPATFLEQAQKDIVFGLILLLAGIKLLTHHLEGRPCWMKRFQHPLLWILLSYLSYSILRTFFIVFEGDTLQNTLLYLRNNVEYALLPFLFLTPLIAKEKHLHMIFKGLLYSLPVVALLGVIEFFIQGSPYLKSFYGGVDFSRAASTLQNPNNLGGYLVTAMGVYILYFFKNKLNAFERWLFIPTLPLAMACLFMTLSRSSILFSFIALSACFLLIFHTSKKEGGENRTRLLKRLAISYILILLVSLVVLYKYFDFSNALYDAYELYIAESVVSQTRAYALFVAFSKLIFDPLGFLFGYSKAVRPAFPDNAFALMLVRNGFIGFILYAAIWYQGFKTCLGRILDPQKTHSFLYLVCLFILLFQFMYGFSANINQNFPHNLYFWLTIATIIWLENPLIKPEDHLVTDIQNEQAPETVSITP